MHDSQVLRGRGWHMAIEARPEPITIGTAQTAVIVVNMQNAQAKCIARRDPSR
jgi:hypothetical protein